MSDNRAWCLSHRKVIFFFWQKCWKCEIKKKCKTISEAKLLMPFKNQLK